MSYHILPFSTLYFCFCSFSIKSSQFSESNDDFLTLPITISVKEIYFKLGESLQKPFRKAFSEIPSAAQPNRSEGVIDTIKHFTGEEAVMLAPKVPTLAISTWMVRSTSLEIYHEGWVRIERNCEKSLRRKETFQAWKQNAKAHTLPFLLRSSCQPTHPFSAGTVVIFHRRRNAFCTSCAKILALEAPNVSICRTSKWTFICENYLTLLWRTEIVSCYSFFLKLTSLILFIF